MSIKVTFVFFQSGCVNTPYWTNGYFGCDAYEDFGLCKNGLVSPFTESGKGSNYPEDNCCACGKKGVGGPTGIPSNLLFLVII